MLYEVLVLVIIGAVAAKVVNHRRGPRLPPNPTEQLVVQGLEEAVEESTASQEIEISEPHAEMDRLLKELESASEALAAALAAEAEFGRQDSHAEFAMARWQQARHNVLGAQEAYTKASDAYRDFVHSLPPPLRANAAARGARAMTTSHA
ncbi:MAG: hypothetical protein C5B58_01310 [Acidobacteria bacterium]|jgi:hypothetical protein|nr:MAG: hypothetical protein C5B58_01310 [Acidobacteriota bacterium]